MIGHANCTVDGHLAAFARLKSRDLLPAAHDGMADIGELDGGMTRVVVEAAEKTCLLAAVPYHKRDEIDAGGIVIMARIMGAIGRGAAKDGH